MNAVVEELRGEKVDIIKWSEDPGQYVGAALAPADVISVTELEEGKSCRVVVPDDQLSLAIGKEGQNARRGSAPPGSAPAWASSPGSPGIGAWVFFLAWCSPPLLWRRALDTGALEQGGPGARAGPEYVRHGGPHRPGAGGGPGGKA